MIILRIQNVGLRGLTEVLAATVWKMLNFNGGRRMYFELLEKQAQDDEPYG